MNPIGGCVRFRAIHRHAEAHCGKWGKTDENWSYPYFYYEYLHFSEVACRLFSKKAFPSLVRPSNPFSFKAFFSSFVLFMC